ncbi:MAG: GAF domain-containing sensor histidine kinase [Chloroflexi bacterium]|jgi:two-component system sensor histidine kinase DevS|nr:GAF domain-containing sensor histidine kinase [Anaerolineaceae bacterium]NMB90579.1 GAF domain-containing sensor histidine kinase [Chloroflexota bacterium]
MVTLTREQLEERLAALHRASLELVQDISVESLLERIAMVACEQAGARYAAVGVLDEKGQLERFITVGMQDNEIRRLSHPPRGEGLIGALMHTKEPIRVADVTSDERSAGFPKGHPVMTSFLGIPIRQGDNQLGQIYLTNKINAPTFTNDDQQVIETLAAYAAIAISNARLYNQLIQRDRVLTRRNENLGLLNDMATTLASSTDIDQILDKTLNQLMDFLNLEMGEIFLRQGDSNTLSLVQHRGRAAGSIWNHDQFQMGEGMVGKTAENGQPALMVLPNNDGHDLDRAFLDGCFHQIACFPLTARRGVLGVMCVATCHPQPFGEMEMQFLSAISALAGTAVENVLLNVQQRRLAVLEERERIGMDLHDGIIQSIYAVGLTLEHARLLMDSDSDQARKRINQAMNDLNSTIRDIRAYILDLRPRQLHDENLMQGIQRLVSEFRANTLVEVTLRGPLDGMVGLPDAQALALFHICQEALANVAKHGRAHHVDVSLWATGERALLEVRDDGHGFEMDKAKVSLGHGLSNMQTRARNVGGDLDINSEPGAGTTVLAWVPYPENPSPTHVATEPVE